MPDLTFQMGWGGALVLLVGALVIGVAYQFVGEPAHDLEWIAGAFGAFVGGFVASEYLGGVSAQGPEFDGLFVVPALIGGIILAAVVDGAVRLIRGTTMPSDA